MHLKHFCGDLLRIYTHNFGRQSPATKVFAFFGRNAVVCLLSTTTAQCGSENLVPTYASKDDAYIYIYIYRAFPFIPKTDRKTEKMTISLKAPIRLCLLLDEGIRNAPPKTLNPSECFAQSSRILPRRGKRQQ